MEDLEFTDEIKLPNLEFFFGEFTTSDKLNSWFYSLDKYFKILEISESKKVRIARTYLRGPAVKWYRDFKQYCRTCGVNYHDYHHFERSLRRKFQDQSQSADLNTRLNTIIQEHDVESYSKEFDDLVNLLPTDYFNEQSLVHRYILGLNEQIRLEVSDKKPDTLIDAYSIAQDIYEKLSHSKDMWTNYQTSHMDYQPSPVINPYLSEAPSSPGPPSRQSSQSSKRKTRNKINRGILNDNPDEESNPNNIVRFRRLFPLEIDNLKRRGYCFYCHRGSHHLVIDCPRPPLKINETSKKTRSTRKSKNSKPSTGSKQDNLSKSPDMFSNSETESLESIILENGEKFVFDEITDEDYNNNNNDNNNSGSENDSNPSSIDDIISTLSDPIVLD